MDISSKVTQRVDKKKYLCSYKFKAVCQRHHLVENGYFLLRFLINNGINPGVNKKFATLFNRFNGFLVLSYTNTKKDVRKKLNRIKFSSFLNFKLNQTNIVCSSRNDHYVGAYP